MKRVLLATLFVIAAFMIVRAQADEQEETTVVLTARQAAALMELDLADLAYRGHKFSVARRHAERAFELDPANRDGLIIIAQSIRKLYRDNDESPANLVRAREAIAAYLRVSNDPDNDEVYSAVRELYFALDEYDLQYEWIMQRAMSSGLLTTKRAEAYTELALLDLNSSRTIIAEAIETIHANETDTQNVEDLDTATKNEIARGHEIASRGLQMAEQAIALNQERDAAWTCAVELLTSIARLFELEGDDSLAKQHNTLAREVAARYVELKSQLEAAARARMVKVDCDAICTRVISTPTPPYPAIARTARASGEVVVQIEIDEKGHVISATAFSGHPLLRAAAVQAALISTFSPLRASRVPVKVYGSLVYNFTLP